MKRTSQDGRWLHRMSRLSIEPANKYSATVSTCNADDDGCDDNDDDDDGSGGTAARCRARPTRSSVGKLSKPGLHVLLTWTLRWLWRTLSEIGRTSQMCRGAAPCAANKAVVTLASTSVGGERPPSHTSAMIVFGGCSHTHTGHSSSSCGVWNAHIIFLSNTINAQSSAQPSNPSDPPPPPSIHAAADGRLAVQPAVCCDGL